MKTVLNCVICQKITATSGVEANVKRHGRCSKISNIYL